MIIIIIIGQRPDFFYAGIPGAVACGHRAFVEAAQEVDGRLKADGEAPGAAQDSWNKPGTQAP
ncbi:hypothetical protein UB46_31025 [Burkholderiaceae bacterium 16]|nr:hypothetical protein UB46_31025 [Burkholderiaceae bacterium 16]